MSASPVPVYVARDGVEAHLVRGLLEQQGIPATVVGDTPILSFRPLSGSGAPQVVVPPEHESAAEEIVESYRRGERRDELQAQSRWKCPNCGEMIEPQFTDCWNCRTPRAGGDAADNSPTLPASDQLNLDLPCTNCQYNLRGLTPGARCPECGALVSVSLFDYLESAEPLDQQLIEQALHKTIEPLARDPSTRPAAVLLLRGLDDALRSTHDEQREDQMQPGDEPIWRQLSAHALCRNAIDFAAFDMGSLQEFLAELRRMNITTARDVGQFLLALVAFGLLPPTKFESGDDFPQTPLEALLFE